MAKASIVILTADAGEVGKVGYVFGDEDYAVDQGSRRDKDVGITDELSASMKKGKEVGCAADDVIGQGEHLTFPALLLEESDLADSLLGLQPTEDLITSEDGKAKAAMRRQLLAGFVLNMGISALHDLRQRISIKQGRRYFHHPF